MIKPLYDNVVLKTIKYQESTKSGLILTTEEKDHPSIGEVIAVGPGRYEDGNTVPLNVSVGDKVIFKQYSTTEISLNDASYLLLKETDILAKIEE